MLGFAKVLGSHNPADIFTKYISRELMRQHIVKMNPEIRDGRAEVTVKLHAIKRRVRQVRAEVKKRKHEAIRQMNGMVEMKDPEVIEGDYLKLSIENEKCIDASMEQWMQKQCSRVGVMRKLLNGGRMKVVNPTLSVGGAKEVRQNGRRQNQLR